MCTTNRYTHLFSQEILTFCHMLQLTRGQIRLFLEHMPTPQNKLGVILNYL